MKEHIQHLSENMGAAAEELRACHQRVENLSKKFQIINTLRGILEVLERINEKLDSALEKKD